MARPEKQGLDYFPLDCQFDDKTELFLMEHGAAGLGILAALWQIAYANKGYYIDFNDDLFLFVKKRVFADINYIKEVIKSAINRGVFDKNLAESEKILTSRGIQRRFLEAAKRRKKVIFCLNYILADVSECKNIVIVDINGDVVSEKPTKKRKEKKRREKESKGEENEPQQTTTKIFETSAPEFEDATITKTGFELTTEWRPSDIAFEAIKRANIPKAFADDELAEFLVFWRGKIADAREWDARFVRNTRSKWDKYGKANAAKAELKPIPNHFRPSRDTFNALITKNIPPDFLESILSNFVIYWRDVGELKPSWNAVFLNYAQVEWKKHMSNLQGKNSMSTRDMTLAQEFETDWATH